MDISNILDVIISYGALGACTAYFAVKDWRLNSKLQETLSDFTIALNAFIGKEMK